VPQETLGKGLVLRVGPRDPLMTLIAMC